MAEDGNMPTIIAKVSALVADQFGGDLRAAFNHYDANGDGVITNEELNDLLADAGVGFWLTRWSWANGMQVELDANRDGRVSWAEFRAPFQR